MSSYLHSAKERFVPLANQLESRPLCKAKRHYDRYVLCMAMVTRTISKQIILRISMIAYVTLMFAYIWFCRITWPHAWFECTSKRRLDLHVFIMSELFNDAFFDQLYLTTVVSCYSNLHLVDIRCACGTTVPYKVKLLLVPGPTNVVKAAIYSLM